MELRHVRYFIAVAETLSFRQAGKHLHVSQPSLSVQIRQLEDELGVALFRRSKRRVEVTRAGEVTDIVDPMTGVKVTFPDLIHLPLLARTFKPI